MSDVACPKCGHLAGMHVRGAAPRYAGCMVRVEDGRRVPPCECDLTPERIAAALDSKEKDRG